MKKLSKQQKEELINKIQEGKQIPDEYRFLIPFETERECELIYAGKERKEDVLAETLSVPFQPIRKFGEMKNGEWHNKLIFGDNLQALKHLLKIKEEGKIRNPDGRNGVKLVYIDPPFATEKEFKGSQGQDAYKDKIAGAEFLEFLRKRIILLKELLTDDGTIYIHLDARKVHYVKVNLDELFSSFEFAEIVWVCGLMGSGKFYPKAHETILCYKAKNAIFEPPLRLGYSARIVNALIRDEKGWYYTRGKESSGGTTFLKTYICNNPKLSKEEAIAEANINRPQTAWSVWIGKEELAEAYNDYPVGTYAYTERENTGYPTQKPELLLERIIRASSKSGDIVLDAFGGSGTTFAVAEKLGRKWIVVDSSKLSIYTMQKRLLNLRAEISNKGKSLQSKPFVLYNAGLYQDSGFIEKMDEADYRKFVLELFGAEPSDHKIKGVQMQGTLNNRPVMVFSQKDFMTYEFIDDLHKTLGSGLKDEMFIIVPQSVARFNEDYVDKGKIRYHILKVPYSIIQKILEKNFIRGLQPLSKKSINQTIESVGFDFIYPPKVECEYYQGKEKTLFDNLVIKIKKFEPLQISKKPLEFDDPKKEALSMVIIDKDYDGKVFDMDHYFFGDEIIKNDFKVILPKQNAGQKIMIIYLDILGNEKIEVKDIKDFKKK